MKKGYIFDQPGNVRYDGTGKPIFPEDKRQETPLSKKKQKPNALVRRSNLTLADVGAIVLADAEENIRIQIQDTIRRQAEAVLGRILYFQKKIAEDQHFLAEFERKAKAIRDGEFAVNKFDGSITFNDPTLERLA